jgi:hypothetical protein
MIDEIKTVIFSEALFIIDKKNILRMCPGVKWVINGFTK